MFSLSLPQPAYDFRWANHSLSWNSSICTQNITLGTNSSSQIVEIAVGAEGQSAFNPSSVSVKPGTTLRFDFQGLNHTLVQSSSANKCSNSSYATAFQQFNPHNVSGTFLVDYLIESNQPQWFYCAQDKPICHDYSGMVFTVNPSNIKYDHANDTRPSDTRPSDSPPSSTPSSSASNTTASFCNGVLTSPSLNRTLASVSFQAYPTSIVPELSSNAHRVTHTLSYVAGLLVVAIL